MTASLIRLISSFAIEVGGILLLLGIVEGFPEGLGMLMLLVLVEGFG